jgi:LacI family transcriptional regulator
METTIKDVARACGVNVSTVSRSLSGSYGVRESTRRKVLAAAERLKYRPNRLARTMATGKSNTLGLMISDIRNPFFAELARGAEDAAYAAGCDLILCNSDLNPDKQMRYLHSLIGKRVDGIVINSVAPLSRSERAELTEFGVPIVLLNRMAGSSKFSTVAADNREGGAMAARYLLSLGHRRLGHITGRNQQGNLNDRTRGFLKATGSGASVEVLRGPHSIESGYEMTRRLMEKHPELTALFAANDAMAFGAVRALLELGKRIPDDISVVGFDNVDLAAIIHPPLTTIHQPKYETGKAAVEMLLNRPPGFIEHRVLGVQLIERQSCRKL